MPQEITIPRLGWSMEEGTMGEWLKKPGEYVRAGDLLFLLEGEKATQEIEAIDSGLLCIPQNAPKVGDPVKVGQVIGYLLAEGELPMDSIPSAPAHAGARAVAPTFSREAKGSTSTQLKSADEGSNPRRVAGPAARRRARELGVDLNSVPTSDPTGRVLSTDVSQLALATRAARGTLNRRIIATPRARRRAREQGVDLTSLAGSGRGGRIRESDVLAAATKISADAGATKLSPPTEPGHYSRASRKRMAIARSMVIGSQHTAPVTLTTKLDAAAMIAKREKWKRESQGVVPGYTDILIQHLAANLREHPEMNACWYQTGIWSYEAINIALAVDTPAGLLAPVIHGADKLSISQIAERSRELIERARAGTISFTELTGATFTLSNLGMFGIDHFTPILSPHQAGILGVGRIVDEPVVRDGRLEVGRTISLSLTFDHRVLDGAPAARWLDSFARRLLQ